MTSIFTKILTQEIPTKIMSETETVFVIKDINPIDTTHLLIIPKEEIKSINDLDRNNISIIGDMLECALAIVKKYNLSEGYDIRINAGDRQEIPHIHMHLVSNREMKNI